jgi:hypothetical protein
MSTSHAIIVVVSQYGEYVFSASLAKISIFARVI